MENSTRQSAIYSCLSRSRRRYTLRCLREAEGSLPLADLAEDVADLETKTPKSRIDKETVKNVYMSLYHNHVPKLADADLVQYDQERDLVELAEYPEKLEEKVQLLASG